MNLNFIKQLFSTSLLLILVSLLSWNTSCTSCHKKNSPEDISNVTNSTPSEVSVEECDKFRIEKGLVSETPNKWGVPEKIYTWKVFRKSPQNDKEILTITSDEFENNKTFVSNIKCDNMFDKHNENIRLTTRYCWATGCNPTVYWFDNDGSNNIPFISYYEGDESPLPIHSIDKQGRPIFKLDDYIDGDFDAIGLSLHKTEAIPLSQYICCADNDLYDCTYQYIPTENEYIRDKIASNRISDRMRRRYLIQFVALYWNTEMTDKLTSMGLNWDSAHALVNQVLSSRNNHESFGSINYDQMIERISGSLDKR